MLHGAPTPLRLGRALRHPLRSTAGNPGRSVGEKSPTPPKPKDSRTNRQQDRPETPAVVEFWLLRKLRSQPPYSAADVARRLATLSPAASLPRTLPALGKDCPSADSRAAGVTSPDPRPPPQTLKKRDGFMLRGSRIGPAGERGARGSRGAEAKRNATKQKAPAQARALFFVANWQQLTA